MSPELLEILRCPETRQTLTVADANLIGRMNAAIKSGQMKNRGGKVVAEPIDGGFVREDGKFLYPIRGKIPVMLIDEGLPV
jgi:uncharacterized protein YbaR (Trm112 family)